jgi:hypothetical protein
MNSQMSSLDDNHEEGIAPSISLVSAPQNATTSQTSLSSLQPASPPSVQLSSLSLPSDGSNASQFLLPIPTPSANKSQASFTYSDISKSDSEGHALGALPSEIASADISIARKYFLYNFILNFERQAGQLMAASWKRLRVRRHAS